MPDRIIPAVIPQEDSFLADLCASDPENYLYIRVFNDVNEYSFTKIQYTLKAKNSGILIQPVPENEINEGMFVTIKCTTQNNTIEYHRAQVIQIDNLGRIQCFKVDEGTQCVVLPQHIFPLSESDMEAPAIAMKCRLEGMELFNGLPHLEMTCRLIKMAEIDEDSYYEATLLGITDGVPTVRLSMNGKHLTENVQQWIPLMCEIPLTKTTSATQATIVHADEEGYVWFHLDHYGKLLRQIEQKLLNFDPESFDFRDIVFQDVNSWKKKYSKIPTAIFITRSKSDDIYYRARMTRPLNKEKSEVEFIDYGNKEVVERKSLILAMTVDENMAFIPPQCTKARLYGIQELDLDKFWDLVPDVVDMRLVLEQQDSDDTPEVEIFQHGTTDSINEALKGRFPEVWQEQVCTSESSDPVLSLNVDIASGVEKLKENPKISDSISESIIEKLDALQIGNNQNTENELNTPIQPYEKISAMEEEVQVSEMEVSNSMDLKPPEGESNFDDQMEYEHLFQKRKSKLSQMIDNFLKEVQAELTEIQNLEKWQKMKQLSVKQEIKLEMENKLESIEIGANTDESGVGSDTSEDVTEPLDLRTNHRKSFDNLGFYKYGEDEWDFSNPICGPSSNSERPQNMIWNFLVTEQHTDGYFSMQSLKSVDEMKELEHSMDCYYSKASRKECPSLHALDLKNNGYYAIFSRAMKRWARVKLLSLPEDELLICLPICLIDYGRYEKIEAREWLDLRPLKKKFLNLPMQGFTGSATAAENVIEFLMSSSPPYSVKCAKDIQRDVYFEGKAIKSYVFSYSKDKLATFPHLKLMFLDYI